MRKKQFKGLHKSIILGLIKNIAERFNEYLHVSAVYSFIKNNCDFSESYKKSFTASVAERLESLFPALLKTRLSYAKKCEQSILSNAAESFYYSFLSLPLRTVGVFLLTYGVSVLFYSLGNFELFEKNVIFSAVAVFASLLFLPVKKSISSCIKSSCILSFFYTESSESAILASRHYTKNQVRGYSTAFLSGILCGVLSYLSTPLKILSVTAAILLCLIFMNNPESSLLFTVLITPFLNTAYVLFFIMITLMSFLGKYLRAKRHIAFELTDIFMLFLALLIAFSGIYTVTPYSSFNTSLKYISAIFLFFLVKNIIRSTDLAERCMKIIITSSVIISLSNIIYAQFYSSYYGAYISLLTDATPGAVSIFTSPNTLGVYLAFLIPITFSMLIGTGKPKFLLITLLHFICILVLGNTVCLYAAILACLTVLAFYNKFWIITIPLFRVFGNLIIKVISVTFSNALFAGNSLSGIEKASIIKSAGDMFYHYPLFGIGLGEAPFKKLFVYFSLPGCEGTEFVNSLAIQILISIGAIGFIFCAAVIFQIYGKNLSYIISLEQKDTRMLSCCIGIFSTAASLIITGLWSYPFSDTRMLITSLLISSLGISFVNSTRNDYISPDTVRDYQKSCGTY